MRFGSGKPRLRRRYRFIQYNNSFFDGIERLKSCLLEVPIVSDEAGDALPAHQLEAHGIDEADAA